MIPKHPFFYFIGISFIDCIDLTNKYIFLFTNNARHKNGTKLYTGNLYLPENIYIGQANITPEISIT